jgi:hypothetical protein
MNGGRFPPGGESSGDPAHPEHGEHASVAPGESMRKHPQAYAS